MGKGFHETLFGELLKIRCRDEDTEDYKVDIVLDNCANFS